MSDEALREDGGTALDGRREYSRRSILKFAGAAAGVAALSPLIAACSTSQSSGPAASSGGGASAGTSPVPSGSLQPPSNTVNLDFWNPFTGGDGPYMRQIVDRFNQDTSTVKVKFTTQKDLYGALHAAKAANRLPQVSIVHLSQIPLNAGDGIFQPIDDLFSTLGLSAKDFTEDLWKRGEWKGHRYGVPLDTHMLSFYWNKDLFTKAGLDPEKPPTTKDEFVNAAQAITQKAGVPGFMVVQGGAGGPFLLGLEWATTFYQQGGELVSSDNSKVTINTDQGVQSTNFWKSLVDQGISPKGTESDSEIAAFKQGKNGMVMSGVWETNGYVDALKDKLGGGPIPKIFGAGVWSDSHNLGITTTKMSDDELQAARYFIAWISEHSVDWAKAGQIPARQSVVNSDAFKQLPILPNIQKQQPDARFYPAVPGAADMVTGPQGAGFAAVQGVTGKADPKAALDTAAANLQKVLDQNRQKYGF